MCMSTEDASEYLGLSEPGGSLIETMMRQALVDMANHLDGRQNRSQNLHPHATRAVFSGTVGRLSKRELFDLLAPLKAETEAHDFSRNLRSPTRARGQNLLTLRSHCVELLRSRAVGNAEPVKGWMFALVHQAALDVLHEATLVQLGWIRSAAPQAQFLLEGWVDEGIERMMGELATQARDAREAVEKGHAVRKIEVFLHYGAALVAEAAGQPILAALQQILANISPELDGYGDPAG